MYSIAKLFNQTQAKLNKLIATNNKKLMENQEGKAIICTIYGIYMLTTIATSLGNTKKGKLLDLINVKQLAKCCPPCITKIVANWQSVKFYRQISF